MHRLSGEGDLRASQEENSLRAVRGGSICAHGKRKDKCHTCTVKSSQNGTKATEQRAKGASQGKVDGKELIDHLPITSAMSTFAAAKLLSPSLPDTNIKLETLATSTISFGTRVQAVAPATNIKLETLATSTISFGTRVQAVAPTPWMLKVVSSSRSSHALARAVLIAYPVEDDTASSSSYTSCTADDRQAPSEAGTMSPPSQTARSNPWATSPPVSPTPDIMRVDDATSMFRLAHARPVRMINEL